MIAFIIGLFILLCAFFIWKAVFPTKKYMNDIYQEMYRKQDKQTKILMDMRNVFFAKSRIKKRGGK